MRLKKPIIAIFFMAGIMIMSVPAFAACSNNADGNPGQAGEIEYFPGTNQLMYCDDTNWLSMSYTPPVLGGNDGYQAQAVSFDGGDDFLGTNFAGGTTHPTTMTVSFWIHRQTLSEGSSQILVLSDDDVDSRFRIRFPFSGSDANVLLIDNKDASGAGDTIARSTIPVLDDGWHHVLISIDSTDSSKRHIYIDDIDVTNAGSTAPELGYDSTQELTIGAETFFGNNKTTAYLADFWLEPGTYIDLSVEANRRKFISATGNPVNLGSDGSAPTGSAPEVFLSGDVSTWHTNDGNGGGFTENGTLTDAGYVDADRFMVANWKLNDTSGTTIVDDRGNYNGTWTDDGDDDVATDVVSNAPEGTALSFGVDNGYFSASADIMSGMTDKITYMAWVNQQTLHGDYAVILQQRSDSSVYNQSFAFLLLNDSDDSLLLANTVGGSVNTLDTGINMSDYLGVWTHLAATYDGSTIKLYVNGVEEFSTALSGNIENSASLVTVGAGQNDAAFNEWFIGYIDDVRIYKSSLTESEIVNIYNETDVPAGLVGYWKLDETTATTAVIDSSGNGNNLTMQNGMTGDTSTTAGVVNTALDFDGAGEFLSGLPFASGELGTVHTIAFWAKSDLWKVNNKIGFGRSGNANVVVGFKDNEMTYGNASGSDIDVGIFADIREWRHYAFVRNGTNVKFYSNGEYRGEGTLNNPAALRLDAFGRRSGGIEFYDGKADDLRIYNRALSAGEIAEIASCAKPGSFYYNFDTEVMQWCDDVASAVNMGPLNQPSSTSAGCFSNVRRGEMDYDSGANEYFYCTGSIAIPIGKQCVSCGGDASEKVMFATARGYDGDGFGGVSGADAICQATADNAGLSGTYRAWIADSDPSTAPATRFSAAIKGSLPIVRTDGVLLANNWADLTDGTLNADPKYDERGAKRQGSINFAWTNVNADGTQAGTADTAHCANWTDRTGDGIAGRYTLNDAAWSNYGPSLDCRRGQVLYCFEQ